MAFSQIIYAAQNGFARITLNRPEKLNAITLTMQSELSEALWEADNDQHVHSVILEGAGPSFCSGYDLTGLGHESVPVSRISGETGKPRGARSLDDDAWQLERAQRYRMALFDMHKPSVCKVHGSCLAGGTDLALLCDMIICADDARFAFPAARDIGALPNNLWLYHVGPQWAKRLTMTGDAISGIDAMKLGLVMKSVPSDELDDEVELLAARFALIDTDLLSANKRIVNLGMELMGARTLQRLAAENDARAHASGGARDFAESVKAHGLRETLHARRAKFGDDTVDIGKR